MNLKFSNNGHSRARRPIELGSLRSLKNTFAPQMGRSDTTGGRVRCKCTRAGVGKIEGRLADHSDGTNVPIRRVTRRELSNAIGEMHAKRVARKRRP